MNQEKNLSLRPIQFAGYDRVIQERIQNNERFRAEFADLDKIVEIEIEIEEGMSYHSLLTFHVYVPT